MKINNRGQRGESLKIIGVDKQAFSSNVIDEYKVLKIINKQSVPMNGLCVS